MLNLSYFLQLPTDSDSGEKNQGMVHLHPMDIELLQRAAERHGLGAKRPSRRSQAGFRIQIRLRFVFTELLDPDRNIEHGSGS